MFTHGPLQRRAAWTRPLAVCLALALIAPPAAPFLTAAQAQEYTPPLTAAGVKSVLLFPAGAAAGGGVPATVGPRLDDAIRTRLSMVGTYKITTYTKFLPSVQRAVSEADSGSGLTDADTRSPFGPADGARARRIASLVGTDAYLLTSVASYAQDAATRRVTLLVNSRVFDSRTGAAVPGLGGTFSGAAGPTSATDSDADIQQGAINDASARVTSSLNAAVPRGASMTVPSSKRGGTNRSGEYALGALLLIGVAAAIISGSHFGGGGGGGGSTSTGTSGGSGTGGGGGSTSNPGPPAPPSLRR